MSRDETTATRPRRERSARYPGVPLAESVELCRFIDDRGLDGLTASDVATALGYKNIKTNTFSARLSAARQFGLLALKDERYALTTLARSILHPVDPNGLGRLYRQAMVEPPLYAELAGQFAGKRVPEATVLANVLYHSHQIIGSAKVAAAEAFLESARFAGALGNDQVLRLAEEVAGPAAEPSAPVATRSAPPLSLAPPAGASDVRLDLRLWGPDAGQTIRVRAPEAITRASFERFLQAFRLLVRVVEDGDAGPVDLGGSGGPPLDDLDGMA